MTSAPRERDRVQDVIKGLAIVLVVYGHLNRGIILQVGDAADRHALLVIDFIVYTTHMPAFFLLAGFNTGKTLSKKSRNDYLVSRMWTIIYPYILWSIALFLSKWALGSIGHVNMAIESQKIFKIWYEPISVFWFLYALLIMQILAVALVNGRILYLVLSVLAVFLLLLLGNVAVPAILKATASHAPFFAIGYWASGWRGRPVALPIMAKPLGLICLGILFALGCWLALLAGVRHPVGFLTLPVSILGILTMMSLSMMIINQNDGNHWLARPIEVVGQASFQIYILHLFSLAAVPRLMEYLGISSVAMLSLAGLIVGIFGSLLLYWLIRRLGLADLLGLTGKPPWRSREVQSPSYGKA